VFTARAGSAAFFNVLEIVVRQEPTRVEYVQQEHGYDDHPAVEEVCADYSARVLCGDTMRTH
jgi:hypothetical protein